MYVICVSILLGSGGLLLFCESRVSMEVLTGADAVFFYIQLLFIHLHVL
jgi:hypothetical protein